MSQRSGSEAESGNAANVIESRDEVRPAAPRLALASNNGEQNTVAPIAVEHIGELTAAELTELARLSEPELRGIQSGAFNKRFGQNELDWSALRTPTPIPPPLAAEPALPSAVKAFYGKAPDAPERAELRIADLSLDLANPFLGSSLLPPPPKKHPWLKPLLITLGGCVLIAAGYAGALWQTDRDLMITALGLESHFAKSANAAQTAESSQSDVSEATPASQTAVENTAATHAAVEAPAQRANAHTAAPVATAVEQPAAPPQPTAAQPAEGVAAAPSATPAPARARGRRARRDLQPASAASLVAPALSAKVVEPAKPVVPAATPAVPAPAAKPAAAPRPTGPLPQELSRAQVQAGLESVRGSVQSCAAGIHGRALLNVTISGAGRVTYASVEGAFAGTPQGSCMARAVRAAQFPQFASPQLRVSYPFAL